jgi:hypothetical protein
MLRSCRDGIGLAARAFVDRLALKVIVRKVHKRRDDMKRALGFIAISTHLHPVSVFAAFRGV